MPHQAYLKLGNIRGPAVIGSKVDDRKGFIPLVGFSHELASEIDPKTGPITKDRRHHALIVMKNIDFTTPRLHRALAEGEEFESARINFYHMPRGGAEKNYFYVVLSKARITSIRSVMPTLADPNNATIHEFEEVSLFYESIAWSHTSPTTKTIEEDSYEGSTFGDPGGIFAPDWIDAEAQAVTLDMLRVATDQAKAQIKAQIEKDKPK